MSNESASESAIQPKQKLTGTVKKITLAGALIDIGQELPGVVHISQIQKESVNKVEDVLSEGQKVDVWVRRVKNDRIELTMIEPLGYEWKEIKPEMIVKGKVVRIENYGAFVDFGAERPGMIHVSELAHGFVKSPSDVVKVDQEVEAMVLDVDRRKKQIRLSMKAITPKPEEKVEEIEMPKPERKGKGKGKRGKQQSLMEMVEEGTREPELTAFEIAWQAALERQNAKHASKGSKKVRAASKEQDEILSRTLQKRLPTGG
ncbi:MAG: S1 RNA-binding domain-containing protein [Anaerolineales bacterium]